MRRRHRRAAKTAITAQAKPEQHAHYCITREDLPIGAKCAQLIHAAGESSPGNLPKGTYAIALQARDEAHLKEIGWTLFKAGIKTKLVFENDAPYTGQLMAIGCEPQERSKIKKLLSKLPLVK